MDLDLYKWFIIRIYWGKANFFDFLLSYLRRYCSRSLILNEFLPYNFPVEYPLSLFFVPQIRNLHHLVANISSHTSPTPLADVLFIAMPPSKPCSSKYFCINHIQYWLYALVSFTESLRYPHWPDLSSPPTPFSPRSICQFHIDTWISCRNSSSLRQHWPTSAELFASLSLVFDLSCSHNELSTPQSADSACSSSRLRSVYLTYFPVPPLTQPALKSTPHLFESYCACLWGWESLAHARLWLSCRSWTRVSKSQGSGSSIVKTSFQSQLNCVESVS